jgi:tartrate dehydrogenase/decarboxylase/D-malate dehydrogenase
MPDSEPPMRRYHVAVIPGDGVGPEVIAQGCRVLERVGSLYGFRLALDELPWGSAYHRRHGRMMPDDALETLRHYDSLYFGAVGTPELPDDYTLWNLLFPIRRALDLYVNLRPVRLFRGVPGPLARVPDGEAIDFVVVRENTEGEYTRLGGRSPGAAGDELALQTAKFTRRGTERVLEHGFGLARGRGLLTSVTKSNALVHSMTFWDEVAERVAARHPEVAWERMHVDAAAYRMVKDPWRFKVLVASNLFGDILSDLGAGLGGSIGLAPSANLHPGRRPNLFEPVHGSAPDLAGQGIANPVGAVWSASMLLDDLGEEGAGAAVLGAIERVLEAGLHTPDLGGRASTGEVGEALVEAIEPAAEGSGRVADAPRGRELDG